MSEVAFIAKAVALLPGALIGEEGTDPMVGLRFEGVLSSDMQAPDSFLTVVTSDTGIEMLADLITRYVERKQS